LAEPDVAELSSPEESAERLELAGALVNALRGLPEVYRRTLFLHYYQGLAPSAIAAAEGASPGTVRWRLAHGRSLLREALQRSDGRTWNDWAVGLTPLTGLGAPAPVAGTAAALTTILAMKTTLLGALVGALTAGGTWLAGDDSSAAEANEASNVTTVVARSGANASPDVAPIVPASSSIGSGRIAGALPEADPDFGIIGHGRITDESGAPVGRARVQLVASPLHWKTVYSDERGGWTAMGLTSGEYEMNVTSPGSLTHRERVAVPDGRAWSRNIRLAEAMTLPVRFETADGETIRPSFRDNERLLGVAVTIEPPPALMEVRTRILSQSECGRFGSRTERATPPDLDDRYQGVLQLTAAPPLYASLVYRNAVLETRVLSGGEEELVFEVPSLTESNGSVRVRLVDRATCAPITDGVDLDSSQGGLMLSPRVDGAAVVFDAVPPGPVDLGLRSREYEALERGVEVGPGQEVDLGTIALGRPESFRVRTVDERGEPVDALARAVRPELTAGLLDLDLRVVGQRGPDGTMDVSWLAPGRTIVRAGGRDGRARVGVEIDTREVKEVELVVPEGVRVALDGVNLAPGEAIVLFDGRGVPLAHTRSLPYTTLLPSGPHAAALLRDGREVRRTEFEVGDEEQIVSLGGR
ncbi:MAG: carboxypeptidase regulatory-like domain-containing protein, partial [Planctomycetota bacterium]